MDFLNAIRAIFSDVLLHAIFYSRQLTLGALVISEWETARWKGR